MRNRRNRRSRYPFQEWPVDVTVFMWPNRARPRRLRSRQSRALGDPVRPLALGSLACLDGSRCGVRQGVGVGEGMGSAASWVGAGSVGVGVAVSVGVGAADSVGVDVGVGTGDSVAIGVAIGVGPAVASGVTASAVDSGL